jgi:hypothetical protein
VPSTSLNFSLSEDYILRFGLARVMARPPLDELRAGRYRDDPVSTPPPLTAWGGNPELDPFLAWQFDVSSEWYFAPEAMFAAAFYYKDVDTHIGYSTVPIQVDGYTYALSGPANGDGGRIKGVEFTFQAPFSFVTALENFGVYSNYAYIDSDVQEFYPWWDPLDASGIAENTATVDLWYSGERFEARLGYKYHSEYTLIYGWTGSDVRTLESEGILGLSLSYQFTDNWGTRFQVNNLTDEPLRVYRDNDPDRLGRYDEYGNYHLVDVPSRTRPPGDEKPPPGCLDRAGTLRGGRVPDFPARGGLLLRRRSLLRQRDGGLRCGVPRERQGPGSFRIVRRTRRQPGAGAPVARRRVDRLQRPGGRQAHHRAGPATPHAGTAGLPLLRRMG